MSTASPIMNEAAATPLPTKTTSSKTTTANMAVSRTAKSKAAAAKAARANADANAVSKQQKTQMHRRSRTGCYTCRLRRKKCDEGAPLCTACKHLGLCCEYKRPHWWSNNDARRHQKDDIKMIIKRKKLTEKTTASHPSLHTSASSVDSPPGLTHSLPTSATFSDPLDRTRSASVDSHYSFNFNSPPTTTSEMGMGNASAFSTPQLHPDYMFTNTFAPYDVDIKTERHMFVNDVPTLHESSTSTFSTFGTPSAPGVGLPPYTCESVDPMDPMEVPIHEASGEWVEHHHLHHQHLPNMTNMQGMQGMPAMPAMHNMHSLPMQHVEHMEHIYTDAGELPGSCCAQADGGVYFANNFVSDKMQQQMMAVELDEGDRHLLDHFVQFVLPTIFPVLETNRCQGSVGSDLILPALQNNKCYLHCCLSIAAQHLKAMEGQQLHSAELDRDIMRHRYATISTLCAALPCEENYQQILEATLAIIFFQCCVGRLDDELPDVSWHQHFQAVVSVVQKLDLPRIVLEPLQVQQVTHVPQAPLQLTPEAQPSPEADATGSSSPKMAPEAMPTVSAVSAVPVVPAVPVASAPVVVENASPFNMTLTAWIDILGAAMKGWAPTFAHTYREKHLSPPHMTSLGLRELMGCEDRVMYLISEIACLEALKANNMNDIVLCQHVSVLGDQIGLTELGEAPIKPPFTEDGELDADQLSRNITAAFRLAARIYLCSLVPGFHPTQPSCIGLVEKLAAVLQTIPSGPSGFDRSVVWVYLMGGFVSLPGSSFRDLFAERIQLMREQAFIGSFGRVVSLLHELWQQQDLLFEQQQQQEMQQREQAQQGPQSSPAMGASPPMVESVPQYVHWREIMQIKGWDFLLV